MSLPGGFRGDEGRKKNHKRPDLEPEDGREEGSSVRFQSQVVRGPLGSTPATKADVDRARLDLGDGTGTSSVPNADGSYGGTIVIEGDDGEQGAGSTVYVGTVDSVNPGAGTAQVTVGGVGTVAATNYVPDGVLAGDAVVLSQDPNDNWLIFGRFPGAASPLEPTFYPPASTATGFPLHITSLPFTGGLGAMSDSSSGNSFHAARVVGVDLNDLLGFGAGVLTYPAGNTVSVYDLGDGSSHQLPPIPNCEYVEQTSFSDSFLWAITVTASNFNSMDEVGKREKNASDTTNYNQKLWYYDPTTEVWTEAAIPDISGQSSARASRYMVLHPTTGGVVLWTYTSNGSKGHQLVLVDELIAGNVRHTLYPADLSGSTSDINLLEFATQGTSSAALAGNQSATSTVDALWFTQATGALAASVTLSGSVYTKFSDARALAVDGDLWGFDRSANELTHVPYNSTALTTWPSALPPEIVNSMLVVPLGVAASTGSLLFAVCERSEDYDPAFVAPTADPWGIPTVWRLDLATRAWTRVWSDASFHCEDNSSWGGVLKGFDLVSDPEVSGGAFLTFTSTGGAAHGYADGGSWVVRLAP